MTTFNAILSAVFGPILGLFGGVSAWIDILLWSVLGGIVALLVYKLVSNQRGIEKTKNDIKVHLLEIRLFQDDLLGILASTGKILAKNALYIGHNVVPMLVMFVPFMAILFQLEAEYAFDPIEPGSVRILKATLDREHTDISTRDVVLELPDGVRLDAPPVRGPDAVAWRLGLDAPGDHHLEIRVGDRTVTKTVAVGGEPRRVPVLRTKSLDGFLYPGEEGLAADDPLYDVRIAYPERDLGWMPGGEIGILATFFVVSIAAGLALKGVFNVTL